MTIQENITEFCKSFYEFSGYPLHYIHNGELVEAFPTPPADLLSLYFRDWEMDRTFSYLVLDDCLQLGALSTPDHAELIIIGPVLMVRPQDMDFDRILRKYAVSPDCKEELASYLYLPPTQSLSKLLRAMDLVHFFLNREHIDSSVLQQEENKTAHAQDRIQHRFLNSSIHAREEESFHHSYESEQAYFQYVENGDMDGLLRYNISSHSTRVGTVADNSLRQQKNICIVFITLTCRAAIRGGLDSETAYQLSDEYIQEAERLSTHESLMYLQRAMVTDYTKRVAAGRLPKALSFAITQSLRYIRNNTNKNLRVEDVAAHAGLSRSYLTRRFREELGFEPSQFILRCKLEEAKSLLVYTDMSLSEISSYLCFSSQSHMGTAFKNKFGMSPGAFRQSQRTSYAADQKPKK